MGGKEASAAVEGNGVAGRIPGHKHEIEISDGSARTALDFIGPSIDMGFRLTRYADIRRMVLSADLALMVLDAVDAVELERSHFHIHLHGKEILKGVIGSQPYPVVWVDMLDGVQDAEERLLGVRRDFRSDDMKDFLRRFIDEADRLRRPFIASDDDPRYNRIDPVLDKLRVEMENEDSQRNYTTEGDPPSAAGEPKQPKAPIRPPDDLTISRF